MRHLKTYLAILVLAAVAACRDKTVAPCDNGNAALEVYCQYADNENLTVAYLGDFEIDGKAIDAVMLQAHDDDEWLALRESFDISPSRIASCDRPSCGENHQVVSVGVGIESNFLETLGIDSLTDRSQITEEHIQKCAHDVASQIRDILSNFQETDSLMPANAFLVGDDSIEIDTSLSYDDYVNAVADGIARNIIEEYFAALDSVKADNSSLSPQKADPILNEAKENGHGGYVTAADYNNQTLWLFFYDDQSELGNILEHIREDIIISE